MATINWSRRKTNGHLDGGYKSLLRGLDFPVDMAGIAMGSATDVINLGTLPAGTFVVGGLIQQVTPGTGTGTLVLRVGTTAVTGTLLATAAANTFTDTVPAACPLVVPAAGAELNLLGATAARPDGIIRVMVMLVEGDRHPKYAALAGRDAS